MKKDLPNQYAYSLRNTKGSSELFGACECCGKYVNSVYHLVQMRRFFIKEMKREDVTFHKCFDKYEHKDCLSKLTERNLLSIQ